MNVSTRKVAQAKIVTLSHKGDRFFRTFRALQFQYPGEKRTQSAMRSACIGKMIKANEEAFLRLVRPYDTWLSVLQRTESAEEPLWCLCGFDHIAILLGPLNQLIYSLPIFSVVIMPLCLLAS